MELTLVRHAPTPDNEAGRFQGWSDPDLSPSGERRARALAGEVAAAGPFDGAWASDLRRAWRTAALATPGVVVRRDARLRELRFGVFEGATWSENERRHGAAFRAWRDDPEGCAPPGGETVGELRRRVDGWLADLPHGARVLVVGHGGPLRMLMARCLALPPRWSMERGLVLRPGAMVRATWGAS